MTTTYHIVLTDGDDFFSGYFDVSSSYVTHFYDYSSNDILAPINTVSYGGITNNVYSPYPFASLILGFVSPYLRLSGVSNVFITSSTLSTTDISTNLCAAINVTLRNGLGSNELCPFIVNPIQPLPYFPPSITIYYITINYIDTVNRNYIFSGYLGVDSNGIIQSFYNYNYPNVNMIAPINTQTNAYNSYVNDNILVTSPSIQFTDNGVALSVPIVFGSVNYNFLFYDQNNGFGIIDTSSNVSSINAISIQPNITFIHNPSQSIPLSNICFPANTPIETDQGIISIDKINPEICTIKDKKIVSITQTISIDNYLVCFEKDSLGLNYPIYQTIMSPEHKVNHNGEMIKAKNFIGHFENVKKISYNGEILYNVLMEDYDKIIVNNLICETLHPKNIIARIYKSNFSEDYKNKIIQKMNERIKNKQSIANTVLPSKENIVQLRRNIVPENISIYNMKRYNNRTRRFLPYYNNFLPQNRVNNIYTRRNINSNNINSNNINTNNNQPLVEASRNISNENISIYNNRTRRFLPYYNNVLSQNRVTNTYTHRNINMNSNNNIARYYAIRSLTKRHPGIYGNFVRKTTRRRR